MTMIDSNAIEEVRLILKFQKLRTRRFEPSAQKALDLGPKDKGVVIAPAKNDFLSAKQKVPESVDCDGVALRMLSSWRTAASSSTSAGNSTLRFA